jgi:hypothetical protein
VAHGMDESTSDDVAGRWMTYAQLARLRGVDKPSALKLALRKRWPRRKDNHSTMQVCVPPDWARPWSDGTAPDMPSDTPSAMADASDLPRVISALEAAITASGDRAKADAATIEMQAALIVAERNRADAEAGRADRAEAARGAAIALADQTVALLKDAVARADRAEQGREGERARADALRDRVEVLQAHAEERAGRAENDVFELKGQLATAQIAAAEAGREAEAARQATHAFLDDDAARRRLGVLARLRAAWRRE